MKHHIIYLPGLSDHKPGQAVLLQGWRLYGVRPHFHYIGWRDHGETFEAKLDKVLERIDDYRGDDNRVSLVGASAGASMALHAYAARRESIHRLATVCGKLRHFESVAESYYTRNPALRDSFERLPAVLSELSAADKAKMLTVRPQRDDVVPVEDMSIVGVASATMPTSGHGVSIAAAMTVYAPRILRFLRS